MRNFFTSSHRQNRLYFGVILGLLSVLGLLELALADRKFRLMAKPPSNAERMTAGETTA